MRPQPTSARDRHLRGLAFLAAVATALLTAPAAHATHVAGATYNGTHAGGGNVTLTLTPTGTQVDSYSLTNLPGSNCTFISAGSTANLTIDSAHSFDRTAANGSFFRGTFSGSQAVSGTLREVSTSGSGCDSGSVTWSATTTHTQCSDGVDNDGDGLVDLTDPGCAHGGDTDEYNPPPACSDGVDNDGDGLVDLADPGCANAADSNEFNPPPACSDGVDNDGDGLVDLADPGCASAADNDEFNPPPPPAACADGIDNDGDGRVDMGDPGCSHPGDSDEFNPPQPPPFVPQQPAFFPPPPGPTAGGTGDAQLDQASCRPARRYRGRTSQGMSLCFTLSRNRRRMTQFEFNWRGVCTSGRIEALTEVGRGGLPLVGPGGRFSIFRSRFNLTGRLVRRRASGTVSISISGSTGFCRSGLVRWNARRG